MAIYSIAVNGPDSFGYAGKISMELFAVGTARPRCLEVVATSANNTQPYRILYLLTGVYRGVGHIAPVHLYPWDLNDTPSASLLEYQGWATRWPTITSGGIASTGMIVYFGASYSSHVSAIFPRGLVFSASRTIGLANSTSIIGPTAGFTVEE